MYSVHKRSLVLWRARLLRSVASFNVYPPPLSDANCPPFSPPGGPGPLASPVCRAAPMSPGSTHIPILSITVLKLNYYWAKGEESRCSSQAQLLLI